MNPHGVPPGSVRTAPMASVAKILAWAGAVGPLVYVVFVSALGLMWDGYDPISDTQSALGAVDSPVGVAMNVGGFMGLGLIALAFAGAYHLVLAPSGAHAVATLLFALGGAGMVVVGFFPCDPGCVDVTSTGRLHSMFSAPGAIAVPVAMMISALAFHRDGRFSTMWQLVAFWLGLLTLATGPVVALELATGADGLLQRLGMWPPFLWMAAVSYKLLALERAG